jgi:hypothetical protein
VAGVGVKRKGGCLFVVEGTTANHITACALQGRVLTHDLFQGISQNNFLYKAFGNPQNKHLLFFVLSIYTAKKQKTLFFFSKKSEKKCFSSNIAKTVSTAFRVFHKEKWKI